VRKLFIRQQEILIIKSIDTLKQNVKSFEVKILSHFFYKQVFLKYESSDSFISYCYWQFFWWTKFFSCNLL